VDGTLEDHAPISAAARPHKVGLHQRLAGALKHVAGRAVAAVDNLLDPYCLSCKRLLGIAGIVILAAVIAYVLRTWVLTGTPPAGVE
jgi:hypothetical protein